MRVPALVAELARQAIFDAEALPVLGDVILSAIDAGEWEWQWPGRRMFAARPNGHWAMRIVREAAEHGER